MEGMEEIILALKWLKSAWYMTDGNTRVAVPLSRTALAGKATAGIGLEVSELDERVMPVSVT